MAKQTILLVDDEADIRELLQLYLVKKGYAVVTAADGKQALQLAKRQQPNLVLLDIEMPGESGFEVCKTLRETLTTPIIFMSVRREVADKIKCFELGGDDYLTKPFDFAELEARVKAHLRRYQSSGGASIDSNLLSFGDLQIDLASCECFLHGKSVELSTKERQLLMHLAKYPNQVWSPEQLYDQIWDLESTGNIQTIKVHISTLRRKLEKDPAHPTYIQTVRGFGYRFNY